MMTGNWPRRRSSLSTSSPFDAPRLMSSTTRSGPRSSYTRRAVAASWAAIGSRPARLSANASRSISSRSSSTSRIRTLLSRAGGRQGEPHACARAQLAVDADAAAMRLDDAFGDRQPEPDAWRIGIGAHAIEPLEEAGLLLARDTGPLIRDADANHVNRGPGHDADDGSLGAVL